MMAILAVASAMLGPPAGQTASPAAEAQALDLLKRAIAFRTVAGPGNQTFEYASMLRDTLIAAGFAPEDVTVERFHDTAYLVARYRGPAKAKKKPIGIIGHMDVVAADPKDWERDPFAPIIENGYIYGRGASDMKYSLSAMVTALVQLKKSGLLPGRDIVLLGSGDEETGMKTTALLAERFSDIEMLLNIDGINGRYGEDGKPQYLGLQAAEKTSAHFTLSVTDPGGHSSAPRPDNAIAMLSRALARISEHRFSPEVNEITRQSLALAAAEAPPKVADAIRRFLANPTDESALTVLYAEPSLVGQIATTCVPTMVTAGHAPNALPQRATATVNCRIFPGTPLARVTQALITVAAEPRVTVEPPKSGPFEAPASPLRPDVMRAVTRGVQARFPGMRVTPVMSAGATDSLHFRARGIPSYGVTPIFIKDSDVFAHGLNERTPLSELAPAITYYQQLLTDLAK